MKVTNTHYFFWGGTFSNWFRSLFTDPNNNLIFANTEQAFMWYKADRFNDYETRTLIEKNTNPREVKKLGRLVKGFDNDIWDSCKFQVMLHVNQLKYHQNNELAKTLLDTGDLILVEASPYDTIWGIGMHEDDTGIDDESNWKGQNLLGKVLMNVRNTLKLQSFLGKSLI